MDKTNIILTRIDNRLVHGQVGVTWANSIHIDTIVVVDDETVHDRIRQKLMESVASTANLDIRFYDVQTFSQRFMSVESSQQLFIVVRSPQEVRRLVELGVDIQKVNVGNMHYERGKVPISRKAYLSEQDVEDLNYLLSQDIELFYQDVPGTISEKITRLDYADLKKRR